jgi:2-methylcitrate dehydratase PrpD
MGHAIPSPESLTQALAGFTLDLAPGDLGAAGMQRMQTLFLDWLGCVLAGSDAPAVAMVRDLCASLGGAPEADDLPGRARTSCLHAALINGVASHVVEMDDLHREAIIHCAAPTLPAILAAAQRTHASGREMLTAMAAAYEVFIRIALGAGPSHYRYWHTTATCGVFGAAAGAGRLLGLDRERLAWALGSAGTVAAGLWEFLADSAMSKLLHPGKAAHDGLLAALLAQRGFTGATRILEGGKGFFAAMSADARPDKVLEGLGKTFHWERASLKQHASCGHTHAAIDALLAATGGRPLDPAAVLRVEARVCSAALDLLGQVAPTTPYLAKFSLPFCLATALVAGRAALEDFTAQRLADPGLARLMERIVLVSDPALSAAYPRAWGARVQVLTADGEALHGAVDHPKGDPENPLSQDEVIRKFMGLAGRRLPAPAARELASRCLELENCPDMAGFFAGRLG